MLAIDPGIAEVWSNLGMALYRLGQNREAIIAFNRASAVKPTLLAPHLFSGMGYLKLGKPERSLGPLQAALAIQPNQPEAVIALSDAYAQTRQFGASVRLLHNALQADPNSEDIGSRLAVTYLEWGKTVGVELRRSPTEYGRLLVKEAIAAEHRDAGEDPVPVPALKLRLDDPDILLLYVRFLETARDPEQALAEATRGAAEFPASAALNGKAGDLLLVSGKDDVGALQYLKQSIQADAKPVRPHVDLARAYARLQHLDDAIREINLVLHADEDGTMHYRLAGWYREAGHPEEAAQALQACQEIKRLKLQREKQFASQVLRQSN